MAALHHSIDMYPVHRVPATRPFIWLARGWDCLVHHWAASLAYGVMVTLLGSLILAYNKHPLYVGAAFIAFLVVGPVIAAGLCELSRRRDHGETSNFQASLDAMRLNRTELLRLATLLMCIAVVIVNLAAFYLYFTTGEAVPAIASTVWGDVARQLSQVHVVTYALAFALVCAITFPLSVVSVPMIIDRHVDAETAVHMSLRATARDLPAMLVWALLLVGLVALGFATRLWGMIIILPLLGHATWYAYRDIVEEA